MEIVWCAATPLDPHGKGILRDWMKGMAQIPSVSPGHEMCHRRKGHGEPCRGPAGDVLMGHPWSSRVSPTYQGDVYHIFCKANIQGNLKHLETSRSCNQEEFGIFRRWPSKDHLDSPRTPTDCSPSRLDDWKDGLAPGSETFGV